MSGLAAFDLHGDSLFNWEENSFEPLGQSDILSLVLSTEWFVLTDTFFFFYLASIFGGRISVFQQYRGTSLQFSRDEVLWLRWWGASRQSSCTDLFLEGWVSLDHEPFLSPLSPRDCPQRCRGFPHISLDAEFYSCFCELLNPITRLKNGSLSYASFTLCTFSRILGVVNVLVYSPVSSLQPRYGVSFIPLSLSSRGISCFLKSWLCRQSLSLLCVSVGYFSVFPSTSFPPSHPQPLCVNTHFTDCTPTRSPGSLSLVVFIIP